MEKITEEFCKINLCPFCKINYSHTTTCEKCHILYWEFNSFLTEEQHDELQIALVKYRPLPIWFESWWDRMNKMKVFI
jgi:hypothetical protein